MHITEMFLIYYLPTMPFNNHPETGCVGVEIHRESEVRASGQETKSRESTMLWCALPSCSNKLKKKKAIKEEVVLQMLPVTSLPQYRQWLQCILFN